MDISVNLGENVTGIGYQFFDASGLIGSRVTSGISNPRPGVYYKAAVSPTSGAIGIYWDNTAGDISASEVFETNAQPANVVELLGTAWLTPAVAGTPDVNVKTFSANSITAASLAADAGAEIADAVWDEATSGHATAGTTGAAIIAAGSAGDPWSTTLPGAYGAGTAGKILGDNLNATVSSRSTYAGGDTAGTTTLLSRLTSTRAGLLDNLDAAISSRMATFTYTAPDNAGIVAIKAKTDNLPAAPAAVGDIPTALQNADAMLNRDMAAVSDTNARSPLNALRALRNKWSIAGGTYTVTKENDSTVAWTSAVSTDAAAVPLIGSDPA